MLAYKVDFNVKLWYYENSELLIKQTHFKVCAEQLSNFPSLCD